MFFLDLRSFRELWILAGQDVTAANTELASEALVRILKDSGGVSVLGMAMAALHL